MFYFDFEDNIEEKLREKCESMRDKEGFRKLFEKLKSSSSNDHTSNCCIMNKVSKHLRVIFTLCIIIWIDIRIMDNFKNLICFKLFAIRQKLIVSNKRLRLKLK